MLYRYFIWVIVRKVRACVVFEVVVPLRSYITGIDEKRSS